MTADEMLFEGRELYADLRRLYSDSVTATILVVALGNTLARCIAEDPMKEYLRITDVCQTLIDVINVERTRP